MGKNIQQMINHDFFQFAGAGAGVHSHMNVWAWNFKTLQYGTSQGRVKKWKCKLFPKGGGGGPQSLHLIKKKITIQQEIKNGFQKALFQS